MAFSQGELRVHVHTPYQTRYHRVEALLRRWMCSFEWPSTGRVRRNFGKDFVQLLEPPSFCLSLRIWLWPQHHS